MRVFLDQLGCRLNFSENSTLAGRLNAAGHHVVVRPEDAHVIVLNTCAVTAQAARKSRQAARHLNKRNPDARIAMTGCYATLAPQESAALPGVELVADNQSKEILHTLLEPWSAEFSDPQDLVRIQPHGTPFAPASPEEEGGRTRAFVKVQDGCQNRCTFCIVTALRGDSRSRTTADVVREVQALVERGFREAVLTGIHLGAYGRDLPGRQRTDLKELTAAILTDTDIARLRLSSLEPWELVGGFFDLWQRWPGRLCPHLHLPLQAGTDAQLRRMARRCTVASFRKLVAGARAAIPDLVITTDLIVGFPGETEADFEEGLRFVEEIRFAHAHIFPFSPRAGTAAAGFDGQVPKTVKRERSRRMHLAIAHTAEMERRRFVGTVRPVLWEGSGQQLTDRPDTLLWSGLTDNYLRVSAQAPAAFDLTNRITSARLDELHGETMYGEPLLPEVRSAGI
ncbi:MAG: tRNA (N(6)-L-threonylcarbamoyladenosine(37)-C(2))-methylthiotransferase MtaB [Caldilineaceae bacterium SB0675_bin_29]|uniref:tRNA (N(6)-L-threonylcarbamoyladenosine(37)-C(2))-methylthiotransferase MtaB n=1 Tax=Caldilineaceae bacterium SB0675_bin_29 TaxID=2605266 RepID=A0A6B1FX21_9CHLR|nr:tRNA (N(6)-L-threonylcarbamoyladenosine(37)-C(2))-methylthiotransferase MtaB [Caldilineaceae bacterium SB0675_bin_29]